MSEQAAEYRARRLPLGGVLTVSAPPRGRGGRSPYRKGALFERELLADFRRRGLLGVRSAASGGPYDLLVAMAGGGLAIQCKACGAEPPAPTIARWLGAMPEVPPGWERQLWVRVLGDGWRCWAA